MRKRGEANAKVNERHSKIERKGKCNWQGRGGGGVSTDGKRVTEGT